MMMTMRNWDDEMDAATERDDRLVSERESRMASGDARTPAASPAEASLYEQAIAAASVRRELPPETIMAEDYRRLADGQYPTPECLTPDELETIYLADPASPPAWANVRLQHVNICSSCRALFASIHPDSESRKKFEEAMEQSFAAKAAAAGTGTKILVKLRQVAAAAVDRVRSGAGH
jgi:hypothetical protein